MTPFFRRHSDPAHGPLPGAFGARLWARLPRPRWLWLVGLLMCPLVQANEGEPDPTLHFITIDVAPWAYRDRQTETEKGAFFDIIAALEKQTGLAIETTLTPFARVDRELESGEHDCTILVPRDQSIVRHGEPVTSHDIGVISLAGNPIAEYDDLHGQTVSLLRGSTISPEFDKDQQIEKVYETDYMMALRKLERERVAGVAGAIPTLLHLARQQGMADKLASPLPLMELPLVFQCSQRSPHLDLMPEINRAIVELRRSGVLDTIAERYDF